MLSVPTLEKNQGNRLLCLSFLFFVFGTQARVGRGRRGRLEVTSARGDRTRAKADQAAAGGALRAGGGLPRAATAARGAWIRACTQRH